jgi:hypothetical protein
MANARKDKIMRVVWLTAAEDASIKAMTKYKSNLDYSNYSQNFGEILQEVIKRGDFK